MDLQELITRGRFLMAGAPARLEVFKRVDGRRTSVDISKETSRQISSVGRDLASLRDGGLIQPKLDANGDPVVRDGATVFEKVPLARTVSLSYFTQPTKKRSTSKRKEPRRQARSISRFPRIPNEPELIDILGDGENQVYEFKGQGVEARKIVKEVAAMLNTHSGGIVLYGIGDDGTVQGADLSQQTLDQSIQSALRNSVDPPPVVKIQNIRILGQTVVALRVPEWNRKDVYQYEGRVLLRKGTTITNATAVEVRQLHEGRPVL